MTELALWALSVDPGCWARLGSYRCCGRLGHKSVHWSKLGGFRRVVWLPSPWLSMEWTLYGKPYSRETIQ